MAEASQRNSLIFTRGRGAPKVKLIFIGLLLAACCALCVHVYVSMLETTERKEIELSNITSLPDLATINEGKDLDRISSEFVVMSKMSAAAEQSALLAAVSERRPVAQAAELAPQIAEEAEQRAAAAEGVQQEFELEPPSVEVMAILIYGGKDRIAMLNVAGEDPGLIVRVGAKFASGFASVTKINEGSVAFSWMGREYTVEMRP